MIQSNSPLLAGFAELGEVLGLPAESLRHASLCHLLPLRSQRVGRTYMFDAGDAHILRSLIDHKREQVGHG